MRCRLDVSLKNVLSAWHAMTTTARILQVSRKARRIIADHTGRGPNDESSTLLRRRRRARVGGKSHDASYRSRIGIKLRKCLGTGVGTQHFVLVLQTCIFQHKIFDLLLEKLHFLVYGKHQVTLHQVLKHAHTMDTNDIGLMERTCSRC